MLRSSPNHGTQRLPNEDDDTSTTKSNKFSLYLHNSPCLHQLSLDHLLWLSGLLGDHSGDMVRGQGGLLFQGLSGLPRVLHLKFRGNRGKLSNFSIKSLH